MESVTVLRKEDYRKLCQGCPRCHLLFLFCYFLLGVYERINSTIYFKELYERIDTTMNQNWRIVDILILEKEQKLNVAAVEYQPRYQDNADVEIEDNNTRDSLEQSNKQECGKTDDIFEDMKKTAYNSILDESIKLL